MFLNKWKIKATVEPEILFEFKPIARRHGLNMRQEEIALAWTKTEIKVSCLDESKDIRLPCRT